MSRHVLNCGYVPLVDSAPLIIAKELGFAEDEGVSLNLLRQPSWAALRDLLALGHLDVAQMLAPMAPAMTLGLSGPRVATIAPMVLSANGTVIGVSNRLAAEMRNTGWAPDITQPKATMAAIVGTSQRPIKVGVPFPYSMHRLLLEYLIASFSPKALDAFAFVSTPPPRMADAVADGDIDLFCVGEPWGSIAVSEGVAELVLPGCSIWAHAPEKVLGMRQDWADQNDPALGALMRAIYRASCWLALTDNNPLAVEILSRTEHLDLPDHAIDPALSGYITPKAGQSPWRVPGFLKFHSEATTFPWRSQGAWIGARLNHLHNDQIPQAILTAADCMRPDLYRRHLAKSGVDLPGASEKIEGALEHSTAVASTRGKMILGPDSFFDGKTFDFSAISVTDF